MEREENSAQEFERRLADAGEGKHLLRLYVSGMTPRSADTLTRLKAICEEHLAGRYELEVIDIRQQPELAQEGQIIVTPTLIKVLPQPLRRLMGDLLDTEKVLRGLNIIRQA